MLEQVIREIGLQRIENEFVKTLEKPALLLRYSDIARNIRKLRPDITRTELATFPKPLVCLSLGEPRWPVNQFVEWYKTIKKDYS